MTPQVVLDLELDISLVSYGQFSPVSPSDGEDLFGVCVLCLGLCFVSGMYELEVHVQVNKWYEYLVWIRSHVLVASEGKLGAPRLHKALSSSL